MCTPKKLVTRNSRSSLLIADAIVFVRYKYFKFISLEL
jgi:hypothetical protein